jgi:hypothetical protein
MRNQIDEVRHVAKVRVDYDVDSMVVIGPD